MLRHRLIPLLLGAALLATSMAAAAAYRWTDSAGNVHFSQELPPNTRVQEVPMPSAPLVGETPPKMPAKSGKAAAATAKKPGRAETADQAEMRKKNCRIARDNLKVLHYAHRVRDAKGNVTVLDNKTRQARIAETQKQIAKFCK